MSSMYHPFRLCGFIKVAVWKGVFIAFMEQNVPEFQSIKRKRMKKVAGNQTKATKNVFCTFNFTITLITFCLMMCRLFLAIWNHLEGYDILKSKPKMAASEDDGCITVPSLCAMSSTRPTLNPSFAKKVSPHTAVLPPLSCSLFL